MLVSLGLIILFSFMGVMVDEVNNPLNIYGWIRGILNANLFFSSLVIRTCFCIEKKRENLDCP